LLVVFERVGAALPTDLSFFVHRHQLCHFIFYRLQRILDRSAENFWERDIAGWWNGDRMLLKITSELDIGGCIALVLTPTALAWV